MQICQVLVKEDSNYNVLWLLWVSAKHMSHQGQTVSVYGV